LETNGGLSRRGIDSMLDAGCKRNLAGVAGFLFLILNNVLQNDAPWV
jgi:hypothetical protein